MEGRIYIAGAFTSVTKTKCGHGKGWLDNDPHFWSNPPTWGICRTDYRRTVSIGDYVFFVLPASSELPQMIFAYLNVKKKITHIQAYSAQNLVNKRMHSGIPNGNIIVDRKGMYNKFDYGIHEDRFDEIKQYYIIGDSKEWRFLNEDQIKRLAPDFMTVLEDIFKVDGKKPYDILYRKGRRMTEEQVLGLLNWLKRNGV